ILFLKASSFSATASWASLRHRSENCAPISLQLLFVGRVLRGEGLILKQHSGGRRLDVSPRAVELIEDFLSLLAKHGYELRLQRPDTRKVIVASLYALQHGVKRLALLRALLTLASLLPSISALAPVRARRTRD